MDGVTVTRWTRYGKDRLYAETADEKVGWHDLASGESHPSRPELGAVLALAVAEWKASAPAASPGAAPISVPRQVGPPPPLLERGSSTVDGLEPGTSSIPEAGPSEWTDLALRRAGALAREQAVAAREAAPVRTFFARALGVHTDERAWRIGADGEEKVAARLAKLAKKDPRWHVLHAVPIGEQGSDIDHVVVGPAGVFTLNAKHHPGASIWVGGNTFMVNGRRQPYIRNSRHEARRAGRLLSAACGFPVVARGIVVPVGADSFKVKTSPADVVVVNRMALDRWLRDQPPVLDDEAIERVFDAARRSTTWEAR